MQRQTITSGVYGPQGLSLNVFTRSAGKGAGRWGNDGAEGGETPMDSDSVTVTELIKHNAA